jgi:RimJ/RimL family protein N-acetyltransferase
LIDRLITHFDRYGFGLWAVEEAGSKSFIGFAGLSIPPFEAAFTPCVEVGWRLARDHWGKGHATEAARAALTFAFQTLGLREVVAMTVPGNARSWRVMEKLGMRRTEEFDHPRVPAGHPLRRHVLYRISTDRTEPGAAPLERARAFAAALDEDDFERARPFVSPHCVYDVRGETLRGADAILASYAAATRSARSRFDDVRYESAVEPGPRIRYTDILRQAGREHRHHCAQSLTFEAGLITRIVHEDLPGEREALQRFLGES